MNKMLQNRDKTLSRNSIKYWKLLTHHYLLIKQKKHPKFKFVSEFYEAYNLKRQNFVKYYSRYKNTGKEASFLPQKRGPKYKLKKTIPFIENKIIEERLNGLGRYDIYKKLQVKLKRFTPKPSTIYNVLKRHNLNRLSPKMKENKRKIIKDRAGEMGHIDCHYLPKGLIENSDKRYYLVGIIDGCTRVAWAEVVEDLKSLTVMFSTLGMMNLLKAEYGVKFEEILTDNGAEFGSGRWAKNKQTNPFERLLLEMKIKHKYTRPYRPQTNGKIERFWRTINEDVFEETSFKNLEELKKEIMNYMIYYNNERPHMGINGENPKKFNEILSSN